MHDDLCHNVSKVNVISKTSNRDFQKDCETRFRKHVKIRTEIVGLI